MTAPSRSAETRVVDHALTSNEFLYQRVDIDGTGANFAVATDLATVRAHDAQVATFEGTGYPGAVVRVELGETAIGSAEVAADGSWTIALAEPIAGTGSYALSFVQSLGSRDGAAYQASLVIGEAPAPWTPDEVDLTAELEGAISVNPDRFAPGTTVQITLPVGHDGTTVHAFAFSEAVPLGAQAVDGNTV